MSTGTGPVALVGSGEFLPQMEAVDEALLAGRPRRVAVIPTAAALEGEARVKWWLDLAHRHYDKLGVETVDVAVFDRHDADAPELAAAIADVGLVYLSGGNPHHLASTMRSTLVWDAVLAAWQAGAALAGCSAGAMALTSGAPPGLRPASASESGRGGGPSTDDTLLEDAGAGIANGLGVIDTLAVIPHYDKMSQWMPEADEYWAKWKPAGTHLVGIEEDTAIVRGAPGWEVHGHQAVFVFDSSPPRRYVAGQVLEFDVPAP